MITDKPRGLASGNDKYIYIYSFTRKRSLIHHTSWSRRVIHQEFKCLYANRLLDHKRRSTTYELYRRMSRIMLNYGVQLVFWTGVGIGTYTLWTFLAPDKEEELRKKYNIPAQGANKKEREKHNQLLMDKMREAAGLDVPKSDSKNS